VALGMAVTSTGCVERVIRDFDEVADGEGGLVETETETDTDIGDTAQLSTDGDQTCYQGVCVGTGLVRVSLSWNVVTDLDLHVRVPNGEWISYEMPSTAYGKLDVDDCVSGACINPDGTHVENVFLDANAPRGTYGVKIVNFDGRQGADYAIEVAGDTAASFVGYLPATMFLEGPVHEFSW
jgi:hypothetical protein